MADGEHTVKFAYARSQCWYSCLVATPIAYDKPDMLTRLIACRHHSSVPQAGCVQADLVDKLVQLLGRCTLLYWVSCILRHAAPHRHADVQHMLILLVCVFVNHHADLTFFKRSLQNMAEFKHCH